MITPENIFLYGINLWSSPAWTVLSHNTPDPTEHECSSKSPNVLMIFGPKYYL